MSDIITYVTIRLEDYTENRRSGVVPGPPYPFVFVDLMEDPTSHVRLLAHTPEALYDLADDLMDLADDLRDAQRHEAAGEHADRGAEV